MYYFDFISKEEREGIEQIKISQFFLFLLDYIFL